MRKRLLFLGLYFVFWLAYFILSKIAFLTYQLDESQQLSRDLLTGIFVHGLKMDVSFTAYLCIIPFLVVALSTLGFVNQSRRTLAIYTFFCLFFLTFLVALDMELFQFWGYRLDATPLAFIDSPKLMFASASSSPLALLILGIIIIGLIFSYLYRKYVHSISRLWLVLHPAYLALFLFLTACLILPIRGGIQLAPLNQSDVYFSKNNFANQAALNVPWNFFRSISKRTYSKHNPYSFMEMDDAKAIVDSLYKPVSFAKELQIQSVSNPNVLIILWESFTAKAVEALNGKYQGITPQFDMLASEGILFTNFYASGDRSAKGLVALLSGYPAQPTESIIKIPNKTSQLPVLSQDFKDLGYRTSFYHGGELSFANMKSYLVQGGFDEIIDKSDFDQADMNSKWGAHDHVLFDRWAIDMAQTKEPFFSVVFTLSSHEPFEVPMEPQFAGDDLESLYLNSLYYTDQSLGKFVDEIKQRPWYRNTIVIVLADHGHRLLDNSQRYHPDKYHIPMLWLGGALQTTDTLVHQVASQTDLPATLLHQLNLGSQHYPWSRDIFHPQTKAFSPFVFNHGIGFIQKDGFYAYDQEGKVLLHRDPKVSNAAILAGKAHLQVLFQDYLDK
ncbi:MAG: LTA synthase family protein [Cyclobacteriaceae bacterium]